MDTGNLFDEDGDPFIQPQLPVSPEPSALTTGEKKPKRKTGLSLKSTLGASSGKRSRSHKLPAAKQTSVVAENMQPSEPVPAPTHAAAPTVLVPRPAQKRIVKPYS